MSDVSKKIAQEFGLQTQPETLLVPRKRSSLYIGIPKERRFQETRVSLTPAAVELLSNHGHRIVIESKAGEIGHFTDQQYSEAGAEITDDIKKVYQANIILKVTPPIAEEMELFQSGQIVFSPLHLPTLKAEIVQSLMDKKVTAVAYEYLKDEIGAYPIVRAISEIAGSAALLIAAEYLSTANGGRGLLLGGDFWNSSN